jgi:hypothetical protein
VEQPLHLVGRDTVNSLGLPAVDSGLAVLVITLPSSHINPRLGRGNLSSGVFGWLYKIFADHNPRHGVKEAGTNALLLQGHSCSKDTTTTVTDPKLVVS